MMKLAKVALAALVVWLSIGTAVAGKLFNNGKSRYAIVLAKDASPSEQTAAEELQSYLEQISGAKLELLSNDNAADHRKVIYVGYSEKYGVKPGIERPKDGDLQCSKILQLHTLTSEQLFLQHGHSGIQQLLRMCFSHGGRCGNVLDKVFCFHTVA